MRQILPVPRGELKKLAEANVTLSIVAGDLLKSVDEVSDPKMQDRLLSFVNRILDVADTVDKTTRSVVSAKGYADSESGV